MDSSVVEIIFSSDLYAQSFKERLKQAVRQEYNNAKQRNNNRNQYQKNSYRYNNNSQQYSNKNKQKDSNNTENKAKSQDEAVLTVFGFGKTKDEATKIALRSAIEQAFGAFVSSNTQLLNDSLISDEIATVSSGNIKHYEYISEQKYENGYSVSLKATVSINKLIHYAESKGSEIEFGGDAFAMNIAMYELNKENEVYAINHLYKEISNQIPFLYDYEITTLTPKKNNESKWEIPITVTIRTNENTLKAFDLILNTFNSISISREEWKKNREMGIGRGGIVTLSVEGGSGKTVRTWGGYTNTTTTYSYKGGKKFGNESFYFRNEDEIFERFINVLNIESDYQSIAFKILDNFKEYGINITTVNEFINVRSNVHELNKYCDSSMKINDNSYPYTGGFSTIYRSESKIAELKLSLIYDSLNEIKKLKNIRIEPTHKSFTELNYEQ